MNWKCIYFINAVIWGLLYLPDCIYSCRRLFMRFRTDIYGLCVNPVMTILTEIVKIACSVLLFLHLATGKQSFDTGIMVAAYRSGNALLLISYYFFFISFIISIYTRNDITHFFIICYRIGHKNIII